MSHIRILYYALVALVGTVALALSAFGVIRSRVPAYWYLIGFYAGFTAMVSVIFIREYLFMNVADYSILVIYQTYAVSSVIAPLFLASLALFLHRLVTVQLMTARDISVVALACGAAVFDFVPGAVTLDLSTLTLGFGPLYQVGNILYMILFAYVLWVIAAALRRDKLPRELVLIFTLLIFGIVGFGESLINVIAGFEVSSIVLKPVQSELLVSTIPYLIFGAVLIYYFGTYLLAESRPAGSLDGSFIERFRISPRESEVIQLLNRGLSNHEIAEKLCVSLATIKTHAHNIYEKTGASSRYDLFHLIR